MSVIIFLVVVGVLGCVVWRIGEPMRLRAEVQDLWDHPRALKANERWPGQSRAAYKRQLELNAAYHRIQPIAAAYKEEAVLTDEAKERAIRELDTLGEHEAANLLR